MTASCGDRQTSRADIHRHGVVERHGQARGILADRDGRLNGATFALEVHGRSLMHVYPAMPYQFSGKVRAGATRVTADGLITRLFDFGHFQENVTFTGNDLANLYYLTGLALPNAPPIACKAI